MVIPQQHQLHPGATRGIIITNYVLQKNTKHNRNPQKVIWSEWGFGLFVALPSITIVREIHSQLVHEPIGAQNNSI